MSGGYYSNYDDVLVQLRDYGLIVSSLTIETPHPVRCKISDDRTKEKRGWYWLSSFNVDSECLIIGAYGIYQGNDNGKQTIKLPKSQRERLTPEQIAAQKARHKEVQKRSEQERIREADNAAVRAKKVWQKCGQSGESAYLTHKKIDAHGIRFTDTGALVVPMLNSHDNIRGLQFIFPKDHKRAQKIGRDKDFWPSGLQMRETFFLIGKPPKDILLIAEGYATGATLYEATGLPVAIVWSANNLLPAAQMLKKKWRRARQLICADDDYLQKCFECGKYTVVETGTCQYCGKEHRKNNAGVINAQAAAVAVGGSWLSPVFITPRPIDKKGLTDFNDLHSVEGLSSVSIQIEAKIQQLGWEERRQRPTVNKGSGEKRSVLKSILTVDEAIERFALVFGGKGTMFDFQEHILVPKADVLDILPEHGWRDLRLSKKVVRLDEVGFDPSGSDHNILCNLWGGWPTVPLKGQCDCLLELLQYLCSYEENSTDVYNWVLDWLSYPIQHPGAKMRTALIFHGPQGTGKNLFFESIMAIYAEYGRIVDQAAIEDKFNDWASKKLFLIADEVVARTELFHIKNKLKCFVTGEWIRINPKNVAAHDERNHVNLVFLSNESQPLVLEKDDRRYTVIHTPDKLPENFYHQVRDEIKNGGIAALHYELINRYLHGFDEHSKPPMTQAKSDLIEVSMDSVNSFLRCWMQGDIPDIPFCPCLGTHLYTIYRRHCEAVGERSPRIYRHFLGTIKMLESWKAGTPSNTFRDRYSLERISRKLVVPPEYLVRGDYARRPDQTAEQWLTESYLSFAEAGKFAE